MTARSVVEIERMILTGLAVTPDRADHIRALVEVELQHLLECGGWPDGLAGGEVSHLDAPLLDGVAPVSESHLVTGLAQSIAQALHSVR